MHIEETIKHNEQIYSIGMDTKTDTRHLTDEFGSTIASIDSSLWVRNSTNCLLGKIKSDQKTQKYIFVLVDGETIIDTKVSLNRWDWEDLLRAEVFVCKWILENGK